MMRALPGKTARHLEVLDVVMGLAETAVVAAGKSTYRDAIAFAILIVVLLIRPRGLLGAVTEEKV